MKRRLILYPSGKYDPTMPAFAVCMAVFLFLLLPSAELHAGTRAVVKSSSGEDFSDVFDEERRGTVTLRYLDSEGRPAAGASFLFFRVALFDKEAKDGRLTDSYSSLLKRKNGSVVPVTPSSKAADLLPYVRKGKKMIRAVSGKNGKLTLKNVPLGVWLVSEETAADGFLRSEPFLFTLPAADSPPDGTGKAAGKTITGWNYHLTLEPKAVRGKTTPTPTPKPQNHPSVPSKSTVPVKTGDRNRAEFFAAMMLFAFVLSMQLLRRRP
jgi:hypothetical protein